MGILPDSINDTIGNLYRPLTGPSKKACFHNPSTGFREYIAHFILILAHFKVQRNVSYTFS